MRRHSPQGKRRPPQILTLPSPTASVWLWLYLMLLWLGATHTTLPWPAMHSCRWYPRMTHPCIQPTSRCNQRHNATWILVCGDVHPNPGQRKIHRLNDHTRALRGPPVPLQLRRLYTHVDFVAKRHDSWRFQHPFFAPKKSISFFPPTPRGFSSWDTTTLPFVASRGVRIHPLFRAQNCII